MKPSHLTSCHEALLHEINSLMTGKRIYLASLLLCISGLSVGSLASGKDPIQELQVPPLCAHRLTSQDEVAENFRRRFRSRSLVAPVSNRRSAFTPSCNAMSRPDLPYNCAR